MLVDICKPEVQYLINCMKAALIPKYGLNLFASQFLKLRRTLQRNDIEQLISNEFSNPQLIKIIITNSNFDIKKLSQMVLNLLSYYVPNFIKLSVC